MIACDVFVRVIMVVNMAAASEAGSATIGWQGLQTMTAVQSTGLRCVCVQFRHVVVCQLADVLSCTHVFGWEWLQWWELQMWGLQCSAAHTCMWLGMAAAV